jgi:1-acyl-sn-glycerol-3-phosphate acyltransferase
MRYFGTVVGSPEVCSELMDKGEPILVFPGGAREVLRNKQDDPYTLFWGEVYRSFLSQRTGFARMAIKHNYKIVPVASVGISEMEMYLWRG